MRDSQRMKYRYKEKDTPALKTTLSLIASGLLLASLAAGSQAAEKETEEMDAHEKAIRLTSDLEQGRKEYKICVVCHAPEGWGSKDGEYPQIAGQLRGVIIKQLDDIRSRNRDNPTMYPFASQRMLDTPQAIADVAGYIAQLPMTTDIGVGDGKDLELGKKLYIEHCAKCHGDAGEGDKADLIPAVRGQHYEYLVRQFEWIRDGKRRNADKKMVKQIQSFSDRDIRAIMDYTSRLPVPEAMQAKPGWVNPDFPEYFRREPK